MIVKMRAILLVWVVHFLLVAYGNTVGREGYSKLKRHLKLVNKPAVKSIKTEYGDIFDCVDIYKQHGFDHPMLENHTIPITHIPVLNRNTIQSHSYGENLTKMRTFFDGGCPEGTVPIRRTRMQDLLRAPSLYLEGKKYTGNVTYTGDTIHPENQIGFGHHWSIIKAQNVKYYGTKVRFIVWRPQLPDNNMFSISQFWVIAGSLTDGNLNTIEAGWTVFPLLFGDAASRLFIFWTSDGYRRTGCYNTQCPGYIHTNPSLPIGGPFDPVSTYDGPQYAFTLQTKQDPKTGDWLLYWNEPDWDGYDVILGYFPKNILPLLGNGPATRVDWGGETYTPPNLPLAPMGSGHFAAEGPRRAALIKRIRVVDTNGKLTDAPLDTEALNDKPGCYGLIDTGVNLGGMIGRFFYYGGPGGTC